MAKKLKKAYKRLDVEEYTNVIRATLIPYYDPFDGEYVTMLWPSTAFIIKKHYHKNIFMGYNVYADLVLLETFSSRKKLGNSLKI